MIPRYWGWALAASLAIIILLLLGKFAGAEAHDWYKDLRNPKGSSCCSGTDCAPVPLDADWVRPTRDGYRVTLTVEQARTINPDAQYPFNAMVPWSQVMAPPPKAMTEMRGEPPALYHLCIAAYSPNTIYCLFAVPDL